MEVGFVRIYIKGIMSGGIVSKRVLSGGGCVLRGLCLKGVLSGGGCESTM